MLHELAGRRSGRGTWWIHAARSPRDHPLAAEAHALLAALPNGHERVFYSTGHAREAPPAAAGRLTKDRLAALGLPAEATAYVCGPQAFMADMRGTLTGLGIAPDRVRTELFGALPPITPGVTGEPARRPHQPPGPAGTGPLVTFARSGIAAPFSDQARSLLEFAESCDVPARWSCRTGVCHTCVTPVLSGGVRYSPGPLEPPPGGQALICCSRPGGDVVLDM
jgi:ferredoxin-NADP reductase